LRSSSPRNGNKKKSKLSIAQVDRDVSEEFEFEVRADTLRKLKRGKKTVLLGLGDPLHLQRMACKQSVMGLYPG